MTDKLGDAGVALRFAEPLVNDYYRSELRKKLKDAGCYDEKTDSFIYPIEAIREFKISSTEGHIVIN